MENSPQSSFNVKMQSSAGRAAAIEAFHSKHCVFFVLVFFGGFCESAEKWLFHGFILCFILCSFRKLIEFKNRQEMFLRVAQLRSRSTKLTVEVKKHGSHLLIRILNNDLTLILAHVKNKKCLFFFLSDSSCQTLVE